MLCRRAIEGVRYNARGVFIVLYLLAMLMLLGVATRAMCVYFYVRGSRAPVLILLLVDGPTDALPTVHYTGVYNA